MNVKNKSLEEKSQKESCKETQLNGTEATKTEATKRMEVNDNDASDDKNDQNESGTEQKTEEKSCYVYDVNKSIDENLIGFFSAASDKRSRIFQGFIDHSYDEKMWKVSKEEEKAPAQSTLFDFSDYEDDYESSDDDDDDEENEVNENEQIVSADPDKENGESKCKRQRMNSENGEVQQAANDENARTTNLLVVNVNNGNK